MIQYSLIPLFDANDVLFTPIVITDAAAYEAWRETEGITLAKKNGRKPRRQPVNVADSTPF